MSHMGRKGENMVGMFKGVQRATKSMHYLLVALSWVLTSEFFFHIEAIP